MKQSKGNAELLKNPVFARVIMLVLIAAAVVIGGRRSLGALINETEKIFLNGYYGDGLGIAEDIQRSWESTSNLLVIGQHAFGSEGSASMKGLEAQLAKMAETADAPLLLAEFNVLIINVKPYYTELTEAPLNEYDRKQSEKLYRDIEENRQRIEADPYHDAVRKVNLKLRIFPANLLKYVAGVKEIKEYDGE